MSQIVRPHSIDSDVFRQARAAAIRWAAKDRSNPFAYQIALSHMLNNVYEPIEYEQMAGPE